MKITVEFSSMEEFLRYVVVDGSVKTEVTYSTPQILAEAREKQKELVEKTAEIAPAEPLPADPVEAAPFEETKQESPEISEDYRMEVRKTLAALNKLQTGNPAKALIAETGYKRLTDVPLEALPGLMEKAKEAMNHV
jgi:hypothetical protein